MLLGSVQETDCLFIVQSVAVNMLQHPSKWPLLRGLKSLPLRLLLIFQWVKVSRWIIAHLPAFDGFSVRYNRHTCLQVKHREKRKKEKDQGEFDWEQSYRSEKGKQITGFCISIRSNLSGLVWRWLDCWWIRTLWRWILTLVAFKSICSAPFPPRPPHHVARHIRGEALWNVLIRLGEGIMMYLPDRKTQSRKCNNNNNRITNECCSKEPRVKSFTNEPFIIASMDIC